MKDGFLKAAALSPALRVADCAYNTRQILTELRAAAARGVKLAVFPEFCLTGYTCGDLFLQRTLQQGALTGLQELLDDLGGVIGAVRHPQRGREGCCFQKSIFHRRISHPVCCVWPRRTDGPLWCT